MSMLKHVWELRQIERQTEQQLLAQGAYVPTYKRVPTILYRTLILFTQGLRLLFGSIGVLVVAGLLALHSVTIQSQTVAGASSVSAEKLQQVMDVQRHATGILANGILLLVVVIMVAAVILAGWQVYWHPLTSTSRFDDIRLLKLRQSMCVFRDARRQLTIFYNDVADLREAELQLALATQQHILTTGQPNVADYEFARAVFRKLKPDFDWEPHEGEQ
ncbi:hypothetical protein [uncultured Weissella sp.]|uniref:hypothetical protein n=1 Tax=uncultured Weissella sp. TaxID=253243 RepID=UPI0025891CB6|nr:hypothetical protein [uncultured Weissella sp.]